MIATRKSLEWTQHFFTLESYSGHHFSTQEFTGTKLLPAETRKVLSSMLGDYIIGGHKIIGGITFLLSIYNIHPRFYCLISKVQAK